MMQSIFSKSANQSIRLLIMITFTMCYWGFSAINAQVSTSEVVLQVDRDYADQFEAEVMTEIQDIENDPNMDADEKKARKKLLISAVDYVLQGVLIDKAFDVSYRKLVHRANNHFPNMPIKEFVEEYKNQFS